MQLEIALQTSEPTDRLKYMLSNMKNFENWKNKLLRRYISYICVFYPVHYKQGRPSFFWGGEYKITVGNSINGVRGKGFLVPNVKNQKIT